jgi:hypothetical protein
MAPDVPGAVLWGLLHDASEAYLADVPRPVKPCLAGYVTLEKRIQQTVAKRFDLAWPIPEVVKRVDNAILVDEMEHLMAPPPADWSLTEPKLGVSINPMPPKDAEHIFLDRYASLTAGQASPP